MSNKWKPLQVGDPVQVLYGGKLYPGKITTIINGGTEVFVKFTNDKGERLIVLRSAREVWAAA